MTTATRRAAAAAVAIVLAACGNGPVDGEVGGVAVAGTIADVAYYHACGNELLELPDGRVFHPLLPEDQDRLGAEDRPRAARSTVAPGATLVLAAPPTALAVAPPGPGDDTGTLTIYEDGLAHWRSDAGTEAWLTEDPITYDWVC